MKAPKHLILIRSSYRDAALSARRLRLTEQITVPSLRVQTDKAFSLVVRIDPRDPCLLARQAAFESVGVPVEYIVPKTDPSLDFHDANNLAGDWPRGGPMLQTRLDDDDSIAKDFVERLHHVRYHAAKRVVLSFPSGFDGQIGKVARRRYADSMFLSVYTPKGDNFSIYDMTHNDLWRHHPANRRVVDEKPAWTHIRHPDALTSMFPRPK